MVYFASRVVKRFQGSRIYTIFADTDIATIPYKVSIQMTKHTITDMGIENFLAEWRK